MPDQTPTDSLDTWEREKASSSSLNKYCSIVKDMDLSVSTGKVRQVNGLSILTEGPGDASIGDIVQVETNKGQRDFLTCEVLGFQGHHLVLMPLGLPTGVFPDAQVRSTGEKLSIPISEDIIGRVLNGLGQPLDGATPLFSNEKLGLDAEPPSPTLRELIRDSMETGIRSIDTLISIGRGQRMGIFAGTGVGKSTLLGMIARYTKADLNVICLVGERGREVREFIESDLGTEGLKRSVVFVATSDRSAMEKVYAAGFASSTAEYFRDRGYHVNFYLDSITRYVMALREIGIASGEQLGPGGFPPRVWYQLSRLVERAGNVSGASITGFYTVLVEADDMTDPIADYVRGILDGHIILSRHLAQRGHYPAIEISDSISRVMDRVISPENLQNALWLRRLLAAYKENEELIRLGAYASGSNMEVDEALGKITQINNFLRQAVNEGDTQENSFRRLAELQRIGEVLAY